MNPEEVYYYHLRFGHGITLAYTVTSQGWVTFSYAICSKKDQYDKAFGRNLAEDRLLNDRQRKVSGFKTESGEKRFFILKDLARRFLQDVRTGKDYINSSSWLRMAVAPRTVRSGDGAHIHLPIEAFLLKTFPSPVTKDAKTG